MGFFDRSERKGDKVAEFSPRVPGRPEGTEHDTGIDFAAWYASGNNTLLHATRDDDPRCMKVLCAEARVAASLAMDYAVNERQQAAVKALNIAIREVSDIADRLPPLPQPHQH